MRCISLGVSIPGKASGVGLSLRMALRLFETGALSGRLQRLHQLGETEVDDLGVTVFRDQDVFRLDVPMNDPALVCLGEPLGDLDAELERAPETEPLGFYGLAEASARDVLHGDEGAASRLVYVDGRRDAGR